MTGKPKDSTRVFLVVQEGGSTGEIYPMFHNTYLQAQKKVTACTTDGAYNAAGPIDVPVHSWIERNREAIALFEESDVLAVIKAAAAKVARKDWDN